MNFKISPMLNWQYDPSVYGIETSVLDEKYDNLHTIASSFRDVQSIIELDSGFGYMHQVFLSSIRPKYYLGLENNQLAREQCHQPIEEQPWFAPRLPTSYSIFKSYSQIPAPPVDMVFIHGTTFHDTYAKLKLAYDHATMIWVTNVTKEAKKAIDHFLNRYVVANTLEEPDNFFIFNNIRAIKFSGDTGDFFAMLPLLKYLGKVDINFVPRDYTRELMSPTKVESLKALLKEQSYIGDINFLDEGVDMDQWRNSAKWSRSIVDSFADAFNAPSGLAQEPWLTCWDNNKVSDVIFCRSLRYHQSDYMWKKLWKKYPGAVFCGLPEEHDAIQSFCPGIPYYPTENFYELAKVMKGAYMVCTNQSAPYWLAAGLGCNIVLECDITYKNSKINRTNIIYIEDDNACRIDMGDFIFC